MKNRNLKPNKHDKQKTCNISGTIGGHQEEGGEQERAIVIKVH
jgi:hypothetical protein